MGVISKSLNGGLRQSVVQQFAVVTLGNYMNVMLKLDCKNLSNTVYTVQKFMTRGTVRYCRKGKAGAPITARSTENVNSACASVQWSLKNSFKRRSKDLGISIISIQ